MLGGLIDRNHILNVISRFSKMSPFFFFLVDWHPMVCQCSKALRATMGSFSLVSIVRQTNEAVCSTELHKQYQRRQPRAGSPRMLKLKSGSVYD